MPTITDINNLDLRTIDTNRDGLIDKDEWKAYGLDEDTFNAVSGQDGKIDEYELGRLNISTALDRNKDGQLTIDEIGGGLYSSLLQNSDFSGGSIDPTSFVLFNFLTQLALRSPLSISQILMDRLMYQVIGALDELDALIREVLDNDSWSTEHEGPSYTHEVIEYYEDEYVKYIYWYKSERDSWYNTNTGKTVYENPGEGNGWTFQPKGTLMRGEIEKKSSETPLKVGDRVNGKTITQISEQSAPYKKPKKVYNETLRYQILDPRLLEAFERMQAIFNMMMAIAAAVEGKEKAKYIVDQIALDIKAITTGEFAKKAGKMQGAIIGAMGQVVSKAQEKIDRNNRDLYQALIADAWAQSRKVKDKRFLYNDDAKYQRQDFADRSTKINQDFENVCARNAKIYKDFVDRKILDATRFADLEGKFLGGYSNIVDNHAGGVNPTDRGSRTGSGPNKRYEFYYHNVDPSSVFAASYANAALDNMVNNYLETKGALQDLNWTITEIAYDIDSGGSKARASAQNALKTNLAVRKQMMNTYFAKVAEETAIYNAKLDSIASGRDLYMERQFSGFDLTKEDDIKKVRKKIEDLGFKMSDPMSGNEAMAIADQMARDMVILASSLFDTSKTLTIGSDGYATINEEHFKTVGDRLNSKQQMLTNLLLACKTLIKFKALGVFLLTGKNIHVNDIDVSSSMYDMSTEMLQQARDVSETKKTQNNYNKDLEKRLEAENTSWLGRVIGAIVGVILTIVGMATSIFGVGFAGIAAGVGLITSMWGLGGTLAEYLVQVKNSNRPDENAPGDPVSDGNETSDDYVIDQGEQKIVDFEKAIKKRIELQKQLTKQLNEMLANEGREALKDVVNQIIHGVSTKADMMRAAQSVATAGYSKDSLSIDMTISQAQEQAEAQNRAKQYEDMVDSLLDAVIKQSIGVVFSVAGPVAGGLGVSETVMNVISGAQAGFNIWNTIDSYQKFQDRINRLGNGNVDNSMALMDNLIKDLEQNKDETSEEIAKELKELKDQGKGLLKDIGNGMVMVDYSVMSKLLRRISEIGAARALMLSTLDARNEMKDEVEGEAGGASSSANYSAASTSMNTFVSSMSQSMQSINQSANNYAQRANQVQQMKEQTSMQLWSMVFSLYQNSLTFLTSVDNIVKVGVGFENAQIGGLLDKGLGKLFSWTGLDNMQFSLLMDDDGVTARPVTFSLQELVHTTTMALLPEMLDEYLPLAKKSKELEGDAKERSRERSSEDSEDKYATARADAESSSNLGSYQNRKNWMRTLYNAWTQEILLGKFLPALLSSANKMGLWNVPFLTSGERQNKHLSDAFFVQFGKVPDPRYTKYFVMQDRYKLPEVKVDLGKDEKDVLENPSKDASDVREMIEQRSGIIVAGGDKEQLVKMYKALKAGKFQYTALDVIRPYYAARSDNGLRFRSSPEVALSKEEQDFFARTDLTPDLIRQFIADKTGTVVMGGTNEELSNYYKSLKAFRQETVPVEAGNDLDLDGTPVALTAEESAVLDNGTEQEIMAMLLKNTGMKVEGASRDQLVQIYKNSKATQSITLRAANNSKEAVYTIKVVDDKESPSRVDTANNIIYMNEADIVDVTSGPNQQKLNYYLMFGRAVWDLLDKSVEKTQNEGRISDVINLPGVVAKHLDAAVPDPSKAEDVRDNTNNIDEHLDREAWANMFAVVAMSKANGVDDPDTVKAFPFLSGIDEAERGEVLAYLNEMRKDISAIFSSTFEPDMPGLGLEFDEMDTAKIADLPESVRQLFPQSVVSSGMTLQEYLATLSPEQKLAMIKTLAEYLRADAKVSQMGKDFNLELDKPSIAANQKLLAAAMRVFQAAKQLSSNTFNGKPADITGVRSALMSLISNLPKEQKDKLAQKLFAAGEGAAELADFMHEVCDELANSTVNKQAVFAVRKMLVGVMEVEEGVHSAAEYLFETETNIASQKVASKVLDAVRDQKGSSVISSALVESRNPNVVYRAVLMIAGKLREEEFDETELFELGLALDEAALTIKEPAIIDLISKVRQMMFDLSREKADARSSEDIGEAVVPDKEVSNYASAVNLKPDTGTASVQPPAAAENYDLFRRLVVEHVEPVMAGIAEKPSGTAGPSALQENTGLADAQRENLGNVQSTIIKRHNGMGSLT